MNKITFLNELEYELDKLSRTERDQIMYHYEGVFYEAEKQNRSEEDVLRELETPKKIAKKYYAKYVKQVRNCWEANAIVFREVKLFMG